MIAVGGGCEEPSRARLRGVWCKFRELATILTKSGASLIVKSVMFGRVASEKSEWRVRKEKSE